MTATPRWEMVEWVVEPKVELITADRRYEKFRCSQPGHAVLGDGVLDVFFPLGWITDVTSTPLIFRSLVPQLGPHSPAALLHDRLLDMGCTLSFSRKWMWRQLKQLPKVHPCRRYLMYAGVWIPDLFRSDPKGGGNTPDGALRHGRNFLTHNDRLLALRKKDDD